MLNELDKTFRPPKARKDVLVNIIGWILLIAIGVSIAERSGPADAADKQLSNELNELLIVAQSSYGPPINVMEDEEDPEIKRELCAEARLDYEKCMDDYRLIRDSGVSGTSMLYTCQQFLEPCRR